MQLGIDAENAEYLFIRHGELAFAKAMERLEARFAKPGPPILSRHALLKALLTGKALDAPLPNIVITTPSVQEALSSEDPGVKAQTNLRNHEAEKLRIVRSEIEDLNSVALAQLLSELKLNFIARKVSPVVMKRLHDGNWESALIMGELVRFYRKRTRGSEWTASEPFLKVERLE